MVQRLYWYRAFVDNFDLFGINRKTVEEAFAPLEDK